MDIGILRRDGRTDPFFDGAAAGRLTVRHCAACDHWIAPGEASCPGCGDEDPRWRDASGEATLVTWTVTHGRPAADGTAPPPAVLALVELAEGPWLHTRLDGVDAAELREGLPLKAVFAHPEEGESYLLFRPA
ncbi:Zn-ribbon domain-containing OB-fold protein [Actinomadura parmotrematis]|uniref:OB-fold domain-containing protein n=1 Tax=Actinomadura parmotrematis TaxID=2864039 RepID=A0ABS7FNL0_9ACTN|nr:OB-fold domain-containing protein [Actinomadura parmotrematis]MBW8481148.1 OB-fold domain-containing protein [Actinomadura parmotrematis]